MGQKITPGYKDGESNFNCMFYVFFLLQLIYLFFYLCNKYFILKIKVFLRFAKIDNSFNFNIIFKNSHYIRNMQALKEKIIAIKYYWRSQHFSTSTVISCSKNV